MVAATVAAEHYERDGQGDTSKILVNMYAEKNDTDSSRGMKLVTTPGSRDADTGNVITGTVRGLAQTDGFSSGKILINDSTTLRTYDASSATFGTITGTVSGTDRVQWTFSELNAACLSGGNIYLADATSIRRATDGITSDPDLAIGSTTTNVAFSAFSYSIAGATYNKAADAIGIAPGNDVIPANKYGAIALEIDAAGTITIAEAADNATGYNTLSAALSGLPDIAVTTVRIGTVVVIRTSGDFTFGTTALDDADTTVTYTDAAVEVGYSALLEDHGQTGFSSIDSIGQRLLATYGSRFCFSSALDFNTTTAINYYTAESSPDGIVAGVVLGEYYYVFGTKTIELWIETGDNSAPFRPVQSLTQACGCYCRDSIVKIDNTLFFIAHDATVRRLTSDTPAIVSKPWLTRILEDVDPADIKCSGMEMEGHAFYIVNTPVGCWAYDISTQMWGKRSTYDTDSWDWVYHIQAGTRHFAAEAGSRFVEMSRDYQSDYMADASTDGTSISREWTAHLSVSAGRSPIPSIRLECTKGVGRQTGQGADPVVQMRLSKDGGNTWGSWRNRSVGKMGEYGRRSIWRMNGRANDPQVISHFRYTDPVTVSVTGVRIGDD